MNKIPQQTIKPQTACSKRHLKEKKTEISPKLLLIVNKLQFSFLHFLWFHKLSKKKKQSISPKKLRIKENEKPEIRRQTPRDRNRHACFTSVSPQHIERNNGKGAKKESSKETERKKDREKKLTRRLHRRSRCNPRPP